MPSPEKRRALHRLLLDSRCPFEDVNINASLWKQLAACCSSKASVGNLIEEASSDYRAAQLSIALLDQRFTLPTLLSILSHTLNTPLPNLSPARPRFGRRPSRRGRAAAAAMCGLRSTKRTSERAELTRAVENTVGVIV